MTADKWVSKCGLIELRFGRWQDVLNRGRASAILTDPPFSGRTHAGHNAGQANAKRQDGGKHDPDCDIVRFGPDGNEFPTLCTCSRGKEKRDLEYSEFDAEKIAEFVSHWSARCAGWIAAMTSHDLIPFWEESLTEAERYVFAPIPCVIPGMTCRRTGDGPSNWCVWLNVSRPRNEEFGRWGTLPGVYFGGRDQNKHIGGKPVDLVSAIVRDYTRHGDLICDPFAGFGTTLIAAAMNGRRAIGAEADRETFEKAIERMSRGYTPVMFVE